MIQAFDGSPAAPFGISAGKREITENPAAKFAPIVVEVVFYAILHLWRAMRRHADVEIRFDLSTMVRAAFVAA